MKELTIEQKAQRYDEALERARKEYKNHESFKGFCEMLVHIFPELKEEESEDERIRKELIRAFKSLNTIKVWNGIERTEILAWLEKQGEHANFRNNIQIGDKVTRNEDGVLINLSQLNRVAKPAEKQVKNNMGISEATKQKLEDNLNKALKKETTESLNEFLDEQNEQSIKWNKNTEGNKPRVNHSVLMKTTHGIAEGEWKGEYWLQYRWSSNVKDSDILSWVELSDLENQGEQKHTDDAEPIVVRDFYSVFSREQVEEIDKRIEESQRLYNAKLRDALRKIDDFPMTD